jgi:hypothetical protein
MFVFDRNFIKRFLFLGLTTNPVSMPIFFPHLLEIKTRDCDDVPTKPEQKLIRHYLEQRGGEHK